MHLRLFLCGLAIWIGATLALRMLRVSFIHPGNVTATLILFGVSFAATAFIARRLCARFRLRREDWPAGAISLLLPTLLLDPLSSAFFHSVFPNMPPDAAGTFGGWMLACCAGGLVGATVHRGERS